MKHKTLRAIALICAATMLTSLPVFAAPAVSAGATAAGGKVAADEAAAPASDAGTTAAPASGAGTATDPATNTGTATDSAINAELAAGQASHAETPAVADAPDDPAAAESEPLTDPASDPAPSESGPATDPAEDAAPAEDSAAASDEAAQSGEAGELPDEALDETDAKEALMEAVGDSVTINYDDYELTFSISDNEKKEATCTISEVFQDSGVNVTIPQTVSINGVPHTVTGMPMIERYYSMAEDTIPAISSITFPDTMRTIPGNLFDWKRNTDATESQLDIPSYGGDYYVSDRTVNPVPDTEATLEAIPGFIKNNYVDGCYYAGKCLVRVDPNYSGDLTVRAGTICILASALEGCGRIGKVTLPDSVEFIGMFAFANSSVTSVNLPKNLKRADSGYVIQHGAFYNCQSLETVSIEASTIGTIPMVAFYNCRSLTGFDFSKVEVIRCYAFAKAFAPGTKIDLKKARFDYGISPFAGSGVGEVTVDFDVPCTAFMDCHSLTKVTLGKNVKEIRMGAFRNCTSLANDVLGETEAKVTLVDFRAFSNTAMTTATVPSSVKNLYAALYADNPHLKTLNWYGPEMEVYSPLFAYLGNSTEIANRPRYGEDDILDIFDDKPKEGGTAVETLNIYGGLDKKSSLASIYQMLPSLKTINIKYAVTEIPEQVFYGDTGLKEVTLSDPSKLKKVGARAFALTGLEEAVVMKGVTYGPCVFQGDKYLKKVVVESGVTELGNFMFERCEALEQVSLPASLKKINWAAFKDSGLKARVYVPKNVTLIEDDAFALTDKNSVGPRQLDIILAGDPQIETVHPKGTVEPMGDTENTWIALPQDVTVYTAKGTNYQAYKAWVEGQAAAGPAEKALPMTYEAVYTGPNPVEIGTAVNDLKVSVTIDGEAVPASQYRLIGDELEAPGTYEITVVFPPLIYGTTSIGRDTIEARFLSATPKKGPVYRFEQANVQRFELQVSRYISVAGGNRYKTAAEIAKKTFPTAPAEAVLVTGEKFPDALAANAYAGAKKAPILMSKLKELPAPTKDLLTKTWGRSVKTVTIIGGGFDKKVESALKSCGVTTIKHIAGKNRYKTAEEVCKAGLNEGLWNTAFPVAVATGQTPADALAFSPWSYGMQLPILLAKNGEVSASTKALIDKFEYCLLLGSSSTVKDSCLSAKQKATGRYDRLSGSNRYKTSLAIAKYFVEKIGAGGYGNAAFADGTDEHFPDALVGGMLQGQLGAPIILTKPGQKDVLNLAGGTMNEEGVIERPVYFLGWSAKGKSSEYGELTKKLREYDGEAVPQI